MDIALYLTTIGILSAIIMAFVIHNLRSNKKDYETNKQNTEFKKQILNWEQKYSDLEQKYSNLQEKISQLQAKQNRNIGGASGIHISDPDLEKCKPTLTSGGHSMPPASASSEPSPDDYHSKRRRLI